MPTAQTVGVRTGGMVTPLLFNYPIRIFISLTSSLSDHVFHNATNYTNRVGREGSRKHPPFHISPRLLARPYAVSRESAHGCSSSLPSPPATVQGAQPAGPMDLASAGRILRAAIIHRTPLTREGALSGGLASKL